MKSKRTLFELILLLAIAVLLIGKFWPAKDAVSAPTVATPVPGIAKSTIAATPAIKAAVEAPKAPPVPVAPTPGGLTVPANGRALYDASKAQATAPEADGITEDDAANFIKNSPDIAKLNNTLAQTAALLQALPPADPPPPPLTISDLGMVALAPGQPVKRTLDAGDEVTLTLSDSPSMDGNWSVRATIVHADENGQRPTSNNRFLNMDGNSVTMTSVTVQLGQPALIKATSVNRSEIHFVPVMASPTGTSP